MLGSKSKASTPALELAYLLVHWVSGLKRRRVEWSYTSIHPCALLVCTGTTLRVPYAPVT